MVLDKIFAIKIKRQDGTYSDRIPIKTLAQNIQWDSTHDISVKEILGNVDVSIKNNQGEIIHPEKTIQGQLDDLSNKKIDYTGLTRYVGEELQGKADEWLNNYLNPNQILKTDNLYSGVNATTEHIAVDAIETNNENRNKLYPIIRDGNNDLSVNVPWQDKDTLSDMQNVWSGKCTTAYDIANKEVILDNIDNIDNLNDFIKHGTTIAVYFTSGSEVKSPTLTISGSNKGAIPIGYAYDRETLVEMDNDTPDAWYTFAPGLKFFTCREISENNFIWLLTTIDYSLISYLNQTIATQDSPELIGKPTAPTAAAGTHDNQIATTEFVHNAMGNILDSHLKTTTEMSVSSQNPPTQPSYDRQYPVVKDSDGNLSVNVPWSSSDADSAIRKIWTGVCNTQTNDAVKIITLDNANTFPSSYIQDGTTIIVYFTKGNSANTPTLRVRENNINILYQLGVDTVSLLQANTPTIFSNWGPGLKIFTYYNRTRVGWLMQTSDMSHIQFLYNNKADTNSPSFTGYPILETPIPTEDNSSKLATTAFVNNAIKSVTQQSIESISKDFDMNTVYSKGDYVYYEGKLYRFIKTHAVGEWDRSEVDEVSITDDLQNAIQNLNSILVNDAIQVTLNNVGSLKSLNNANGFIRQVDEDDLITYRYNYIQNIHKTSDPYIKTPNTYSGNRQLIGFKFRLINSIEVPLSSVYNKFYITLGGIQLKYDVSNISGKWVYASLYIPTNTNLNEIKLYLHADPDYDYGSAFVTVEIKDFYRYILPEEIADNINFRNYIINEQNRNYRTGNQSYSLPKYNTDKTLTQEGKAADAKAVGDMFNNVLVETESDKMTVSNWLSLNNQKWQSSNLNRITQYSSNYIKFNFEITNSSGTGPKSFYIANVPQITITTPRYVLIGFKYKFYSSNEFSSLKFMKSPISFDEEDVILTNKNQQEWQDFSGIFYKKNINNGTNLQNYFAFAASYENLSNNQNFNVIFEIKDFYIYYFNTSIFNTHNLLINYIRRKQSQDYHDGTVTYQTPKYIPDTSLSISGKAADAAAVRDAINDFTVDQESYTLTNLTPLENFEPAPVFVTEDEDGYTKIYHIQDSNYGTQNYDDPNDPHYVDRFNYVPRAYSKYQYIICNIDINFDPTKTYLINFQYAFLYGLCDSLVLYCSANFGASEYVIFDKEQDSLPLSSGEFKRYFKILDPPRYDNMAIKLKYSNSELNGQLFDETFYIKNLYLYDITSIKSNKNLINYIKEKQSNYDINPIDEIFTYTLPKTDFSLSLLGKAADAKAVGNAINAIAPPDWNRITRLVNESGPYINTMTISNSGWYSLEVGKSNSSTSVSGSISLYDARQEHVTYDLAFVSDHSSDNLVLFTPWLYFTAGTTIHINGYAHFVRFYYAPCMQLGL